MKTSDMPRIRIYHNNLWARYKGAIFSKIHTGSDRSGVATSFVQVTETSTARIGLGGVDRSYHRYPFEVLFPGAYEQIPRYKIVAALSANLLRNRSDLVVIPGYHRVEYWVMLVLCMLLRRKRAVFVDSTAYDRDKIAWKEAAKGFFFRRCDGFFCYGIRSKEYVASYGIDERKIYDRCQAAALPHDYDPETIRGYYGRIGRSVDAPPRFLYVGRLSVEKGLADLLEAFRGVRAQLPDARLDIVGSGPLELELKEHSKRLGVEFAVDFLGTKTPDDIGRLLMRSTALVLPSHREPWGLVVNEALSFGCPVVVSNICGCVPELVRDGVTGYSYPFGDIQALRAALMGAVELSKNRPMVAAQCLDLIGQYTPERAASEILDGCVCITKPPQ
ncbi:MAG: glycosyltransferase [Steroidobacteraceae bacterium]|jgi:glycosyltransferase involved in cell wall biosynthesis